MAIFTLAVMAVGCGQRKAESFMALPFPDVKLPGMLENDMSAGVEYAVEHFWDAFTDPSRAYPCDSVLVSGVKRADVEQKFVNWMSLLETVGPVTMEKSVARLYDRCLACERRDSSSNVFETFRELADRYMYDPNSPMRNEDIYLPFISRLASFEGLSAAEKGKYEREAHLCALNRGGTVAADFRFMDVGGRVRTLHGIDAEWTLLFFSNPGCEACMDIINTLKGSPRVASMLEEGRLAVVNVYIDEDIAAWRSYKEIYPKEWYNGFDPDMVIRNDILYNVRAIPSLYILDSAKRVILKDAPEPKIFDFIENKLM